MSATDMAGRPGRAGGRAATVPARTPAPGRPGRAGGRAWEGDEGSAIVEFVSLGVLLMVPLVYLVIVLAQLQSAVFAVESAARDGARSYVSAPDVTTARARLAALTTLALTDQGLADDDDPPPQVQVACSAQPCLTPEASVTVTVRVEVVLPGLPAFAERLVGARIPVQADASAVVDGYRESSHD
jgi:hypothetical protein